MKKLLIAAICIAGMLSLKAQGTVNLFDLNNGNISNWGDVPGGAAWGQLYAGTGGSLAPVGSPVSYAGGFLVGTVDVPEGPPVDVQIRAWSGDSPSWEAAQGDLEAWAGMSAIGSMAALGGGGSPPAPPVSIATAGIGSITMTQVIPEPSTIALGILGAAVLLLRRRK